MDRWIGYRRPASAGLSERLKERVLAKGRPANRGRHNINLREGLLTALVAPSARLRRGRARKGKIEEGMSRVAPGPAIADNGQQVRRRALNGSGNVAEASFRVTPCAPPSGEGADRLLTRTALPGLHCPPCPHYPGSTLVALVPARERAAAWRSAP